MSKRKSRAASIESDDLDIIKTGTKSKYFASATRTTTSAGSKSTKSTPATSVPEESDGEQGSERKNVRSIRRSSRTVAKTAVTTAVKVAGKKRSRLASEDLDADEDDHGTTSNAPGTTSTSAANSDVEMDTASRSVKKRKMAVYVEIPPRPQPAKGKGKALATTTTPARKEPQKTLTPASRSSRASSAKSKAVTAALDTEMLSNSSLNYDEEVDQESVPSSDSDEGSVFEASEDDEDELVLLGTPEGSGGDEEDDFEEIIPLRKGKGKAKARAARTESVASSDNDIPLAHVMAEDDEDEAAMLNIAIEASLSTRARKGQTDSPRSAARTARAEAAERRLLKRASGLDLNDVDDTVLLSDDSSAISSDDEDVDDDAGGFVKPKGKKKASAKPTVKAKKMSRKDQNAAARAAKDPVGTLLRAAKKELGRKLTYAERTTIMLRVHHPELKDVWGDLERAVKPITPEKADPPPGLKVTLLPFQRESLFWMRKQELGVWKGGCLADEMGMGKTIQTLALLASDRRKPNLIVAPTVAVMQWRNEIEAHTDGFKIAIFHGGSREKDAKVLANNDVVLTTYAVLESTFRRQHSGFTKKGVKIKEKSVLHTIHWARIVLDEAHNIKERSSNTAKAAFELKSDYKWCLSGTPLQNRVGELYSLVRFLGGDPFSYYFCKQCPCKSLHWAFENNRSCKECGHSPMLHTCFWNNEILTPIQKHAMQGPGQTAFKKLKILLDRMMLRRTKLERADDLGLPPRTVIVRRDYFSPEEKELYLSLFSDAKRQFSTFVDAGTLLNNYSNIFSLITRMRQMACHPDLVLKSRRNVDISGEIEETTVCRLCNDIAEDAIKASCHHVFDRECIRQYIDISADTVPDCPVCHVALSIDLDAPALEQDDTAVTKARQGILGRLDFDGWRSSSKIEALVEELSNLRREDRTTKSIVFSQFVNFLDLIAWRLQRAGFNICRLEGTMTPQARDLTIKHFMNNVEVTVFLVSLKAGGVALNLVEASRVYLMDSWWNPAVEFQAMDRIHRLGQHRPVQAIKLVIEDSIESRIVQLQEKKSAMVDATLSADDSAMGRLTPEDLGFLFRL